MKRKIIQIATTDEKRNQISQANLIALCDDNTIWARDIESNNRWYEIDTESITNGESFKDKRNQ